MQLHDIINLSKNFTRLSTLNFHFLCDNNTLFVMLTLCSRDRIFVALGLDLFAVNDEKFMDMFVAPGAIDVLQSERESLMKRQKMLQSCLNEFKSVAQAL